MALPGPTEWCRIELFIAHVDVGAMGDQELHHHFVAVDRGPVQTRSAEEAPAVDVRALVQKKFCHVDVAVSGRDVEGLGDQRLVGFGWGRSGPAAVRQSARARLSVVWLERAE